MLNIKSIQFYENGSVMGIEFVDLAKPEEVAAFCAKYKIGWQNFHLEALEKTTKDINDIPSPLTMPYVVNE
jgi:hypothetical protein